MDIRKELLREHSLKQTRKIADYVVDSPSRFKTLVNTFLGGPQLVSQRASWAVSYCAEAFPKLINPHYKALLLMAKTPGTHNAIKRNVMRIFQFVDVPPRYRGQVADLCFLFLTNTKEPVAIRVFAMTVLSNISQYEPDLKPELRIIIEDQLPYGSAAFLSRGRKILKTL